jgi:hypothetical protein
MNWYKKSQTDYPYSLLETIKMQGEHGLSLGSMNHYELENAKELELHGFINKVTKQDKSGKYLAYVINEDKVKQMGWKV